MNSLDKSKEFDMILAEKIVNLRKKTGWSQEELAQQLDVSRQSVSKWESGQSIPDMDKIVKMSAIFSVSTDYLLKDDISEDESIPQVQTTEPGLRHVSMEEAVTYMEIRSDASHKIALASMLCIISPIPLILLSGLSELTNVNINGSAAAGMGICFLAVFVAIAVSFFLKCSFNASEYSFLEKEPFDTEYGVTGLVKKKKADFREKYARANIISTVLCILSVFPLFTAVGFDSSDFIYIIAVCILLAVIAIAVYGFVFVGTVNASYDKLLKEGDFKMVKKEEPKGFSIFVIIYWLVVTMLILIMIFFKWNIRYIWIPTLVSNLIYWSIFGIRATINSNKR